MSLGVTFKGPEGIVLAVDSRVTLFSKGEIVLGVPQIFHTTYDNATKLLKISGQRYLGAITYGVGSIGQGEPRTAHSFIPEFEDELAKDPQLIEEGEHGLVVRRLGVFEFAQRLSSFFQRQWIASGEQFFTNEDMVFVVAGYDAGEAYGKVFDFLIPNRPTPIEQHAGTFGVLWGGQADIVGKLLQGYAPNLPFLIQQKYALTDKERDEFTAEFALQTASPIPYQFLPLQDCIDFSSFLIRTTIDLQKWQGGNTFRGVGGAIDIAAITRVEGFRAIQEKTLAGERGGD